MVAGKNALSGGADMLSVVSKINTAKPKKNNDSEFKTMLDKNAQNTQQNTQNTQNTDAAAKPEAPNKENPPAAENSAEVPKDENVEESGIALEVAAQFVILPEQERASLNWAEETPADISGKITETEAVGKVVEGAAEAGAQQKDSQATLTKDESGLFGQNQKGAEEGGETAKAVETPDAGKNQQTEAVKEVKVQGAEETKQDGAAEKTDAKAGADAAKGTAKEENASAQDVSAHTAAPKEVQDDDMLNFKVGDSVKLAEPKAAQEMADTIMVRASQGNREFEMQLNPEELGKVKIKMVFEEGKIHIAMTCDNQKAMDLLSSTSSRLKEMIEERTGSEVNVHVEQESETPYHEQEKQNGKENDAQQNTNRRQGGKESADSMDFIQQLRLGLVEAE